MNASQLARGAWIVGLTCVLAVQPAEASVHLMQIEQVIGGVDGDTSAQAIQLRMRSNFQNQLGGSRLRVWDAAGLNPILVADPTNSVAGASQGDRVLIASAGFTGVTDPAAVADFTIDNLIPPSYLAAGSLTFENNAGTVIYWRLIWGGASYTGPTTGATTNDTDGDFGPPFPGPLPSTGTDAVQFQGPANAQSTTNLADYALTSGGAVFTNNAGVSFTVDGAASCAPFGDSNCDGDVDLADHDDLFDCLAGPDAVPDPTAPLTPADCLDAFDSDDDGDVDLVNFGAFQEAFTGPS
ncbi:MAG: hypothetical protein GY778_06660 [bacterium]|nr:hypothetical protein [bacterium]